MARVLTLGAEMGDALPFTAGTAQAAAVYSVGSYGYRFLAPGYVAFTAGAEFYLRAHVQLLSSTNGTAWIAFSSGTNIHAQITLDAATGSLKYYAGGSGTLVATGTANLVTLGTWFTLEIYIKIADSGGSFVVKIDDTTDCNFSGDTKYSTFTTMNRITFQRPHSSDAAAYIYVDDFAMNDISGTDSNSWVGDGYIVSLAPTGDGYTSDWTTSSGTAHYAMVDEVPHDTDTTYVFENGASQYDSYTMANTGLSGVDILCVHSEARWKMMTGSIGTAYMGLFHRISSTNYLGGQDSTTNTTYQYIGGDHHTLNPYTGVVWTVSDVDGMEAGVYRTTSGAVCRATNFRVMVDYRPTPATGRIQGPAAQCMG